ncbi:MAG TPA: hypothetical protein PLD25_04300 [Chloroflexota bacterium]|nr:hypothetical protein [Chloroflexota bacterium]HUM71551.1 hypothetical protein [Chloroflexota bacterium]
MEESFVTTSEIHPSTWTRAARVLLSLIAGTGAGLLLGRLVALTGVMGHDRVFITLPLLLGIIASIGVGIGLARYDELSPGLVAGMVGYVVLGLAGYALLFGVIGLFVGGTVGWQVGVFVGAVVGTAVGVYARLIKYRYRHF